MSKELAAALETLEKEKGISKDIVVDALETALISAYKRNYGTAQNVDVVFDDGNGDIKVYQVKDVVEEVETEDAKQFQIALSDALEINKAYEVGDKIKFEVTPRNFGRIAAQTAKQVIMQRMREAERLIIYNEYIEYQDDLMTGTVERQDDRFIYINLGKVEAVLSTRDQIEGEVYKAHDRIKVYISKVEDSTKGPQVFVSRTHPNLIKRLFEQEVPEIYDGVVEVVSIAREAGDRSKVAVTSQDENVDPVGTCVGPRGSRVQTIVNELNGENMDIVEWDKDPAIFIQNALNPAEVVDVRFDKDENTCVVVVPDYQLSLAIGKRGQNVRLAAKLTGFKIDIKSESDVEELKNNSEELEDDSFFDELQPEEKKENTNDDLFDLLDEESTVENPDVDEIATDSNEDSSLIADEVSNKENQPGEPIDDIEIQDGEVAPEEMEDLIEEAEKRDGLDGEDLETTASVDDLEDLADLEDGIVSEEDLDTQENEDLLTDEDN